MSCAKDSVTISDHFGCSGSLFRYSSYTSLQTLTNHKPIYWYIVNVTRTTAIFLLRCFYFSFNSTISELFSSIEGSESFSSLIDFTLSSSDLEGVNAFCERFSSAEQASSTPLSDPFRLGFDFFVLIFDGLTLPLGLPGWRFDFVLPLLFHIHSIKEEKK